VASEVRRPVSQARGGATRRTSTHVRRRWGDYTTQVCREACGSQACACGCGAPQRQRRVSTCLVLDLQVDLCIIELRLLLLVRHGCASYDAVVRRRGKGKKLALCANVAGALNECSTQTQTLRRICACVKYFAAVARVGGAAARPRKHALPVLAPLHAAPPLPQPRLRSRQPGALKAHEDDRESAVTNAPWGIGHFTHAHPRRRACITIASMLSPSSISSCSNEGWHATVA
jgi:hypothetical protein